MSLARRAAVLIVVTAGLAPLRADGPVPARADDELLRQVVEEHRISTTEPFPGLGQYLADLGAEIAKAMASALGDFFGVGGAVAVGLAWAIFAAAAVVLAVLAARWLVGRPRRRRPAAEPSVVAVPSLGAGSSSEDPGERLRRCLEVGDVVAALEALWWWLAARLMPRLAEPAEPSWTSRELVLRAGRRDLLSLVRRLDRMIYGGAVPSVADVRGLWHDFQEGVG